MEFSFNNFIAAKLKFDRLSKYYASPVSINVDVEEVFNYTPKGYFKIDESYVVQKSFNSSFFLNKHSFNNRKKEIYIPYYIKTIEVENKKTINIVEYNNNSYLNLNHNLKDSLDFIAYSILFRNINDSDIFSNTVKNMKPFKKEEIRDINDLKTFSMINDAVKKYILDNCIIIDGELYYRGHAYYRKEKKTFILTVVIKDYMEDMGYFKRSEEKEESIDCINRGLINNIKDKKTIEEEIFVSNFLYRL